MRQLSLFVLASTMIEQGIYRSLVVISSGRGSRSSSRRMVVMVVAVVVSRSSSRPRRTVLLCPINASRSIREC